MELYSILGKAGKDMDIGISADDYVNGLFLLPFDVTPTSTANMEYLSKNTEETVELNCNLKSPYKTTLLL